MNFSKLAVRTRLYFGFGLMLVILVAVTIISISQVMAINGALRANSEENASIQRFAINFRGSAHDRSIAIRDVVLSATSEGRQTEVAAIERLAGFYANSAGPLEKLVSTAADSAEIYRLYGDIKANDAQAVATTKTIIALVEKGHAAEAQTLLWSQAKPQYVQWLASINKLIDSEEERIQAKNKVALGAAGGFLNVILVALVMSVLCGAALAWFTSRSIVGQLGAEPAMLGDAAKRIANGDLRPIETMSSAAAGSVFASLSDMRDNLAQIVGQVRQSSDSIATGSAQIATGNADLSQRTEEQASNLQQTAASMEELTSTVKQNSDTARQANQLASSASQAATQGGVVVSQVVGTMEEITASSRKIADIISVIDGIAFQTNILALNAAVEAARAGEQGRGFAVVAGEVRNLAQRSSEAAKEIKSLIGQSVEKVEAGSKLVDDAGKSMADIVVQVRRVNDLIAEISSASIEQSSGISQVGDAVAQLDQVTQQNAALVEESAAAADSLKQQAANLAEVVSVFKLANEGSHQGASYAAAAAARPAAKPAAQERRGPNRATNVTRPKFGPSTTHAHAHAHAATAAAATATATARNTPAQASAKTGSDDWEAF